MRGTMRAQRTARTAVAVLLTVPFIVPFLMLVSTSVRTRADFIANPGGLPRSFTLGNIAGVWRTADLGSALEATVITCVMACLVAVFPSLSGAYWFRTHRSGRVIGLTRWALAAAYAIPTIAWLIPVFVLLSQVGWTSNVYVLGVVDGISSLPFTFYLLYTFFNQALPNDLLEAASLDGASYLRTFRSIAIPMSLPALATTTALVFVWTFGDLLVATTLLDGGASVRTLTLATASLASRENLDLQGQAAASLITLLPALLVVVGAQKALVRGFGAGSGK